MKRISFFMLILFLLSYCDSATESNNNSILDTTDNNSTTKIAKFYIGLEDSSGDEILCKFPICENSQKQVCYVKSTKEAVECPCDETGNIDVTNCKPISNTGSFDPPCDNPKFPGDGKSGEQCWDPPENYCKLGANMAIGIFCNPETKNCCYFGSSDCYYCGWIACGSGLVINNPENPCYEIVQNLKNIDEQKWKCLTDPNEADSNECLKYRTEDPSCNNEDIKLTNFYICDE